MKPTFDAAFETAIKEVLLAQGYGHLDSESFDRKRAVFPEVALDFIRTTQSEAWGKLEALHGDETGERVPAALCKWMDRERYPAALRHGFKCLGKNLRVAFFRLAHGLDLELDARYRANRPGVARQARLGLIPQLASHTSERFLFILEHRRHPDHPIQRKPVAEYCPAKKRIYGNSCI